MQLNHKVGLVSGLCLACLHGIWASCVGLGLAQKYLDWIFWLHFLNNPFTVRAFSLTQALGLVSFTFVVGYTLGIVSALVWDRCVD